jgi:hypothetical protein
MSEITSASPAAKRPRLAESRASNALALQTYRVRLTLSFAPGKFGKRVFDVHQESTFQELHEAICKSFNRGLGYHLYQFSYPIQSYAAKTTGMKKADVLEWCLAFGVPTEGLKVPEMKARLSQIEKRLHADERARQRAYERSLFRRDDDDDDDDDAAPGSKMKAFVVEDQSRPGYDPKYNESYDGVSHVGSMDTKLSDVMLAKDDLLEYVWDLGANWAHVMVVESSRDATPEEAEAKVKLVWTNNLSEPEE